MRQVRNTSAATALAGISLMLSAPAAAQQAADGHLYGPAPAWEEFRQIAEARILSQLVDPESARFDWVGGYYKGDFKVFLGPRYHGYVACGTVNSKNRMGGYVGATTFMVVIDYGRVLLSQMDRTADIQCSQLLREGKIPPLPSTGTGTTSNTAGLSLRPMPEGAYVSAVVPGSAAALAGLKPGMVITSVNAIPLAGMDTGMLKVIEAAGAQASFSVVGGSSYKLGGQP